MIEHKRIESVYPKTIAWYGDKIIDWVSSGTIYSTENNLEGKIGKYNIKGDFDTCITSKNYKYSLLYKKLGNKALIIKDGKVIRKVKRDKYHSYTYDYPAIFIDIKDKTYLIHCPNSYNKIDIEDVETGEFITISNQRLIADFFHSRFELSDNNKILLSKGWVWHPMEFISIFDLEKCIENPYFLDNSNYHPKFNTEINTASIINDNLILIGSTEESDLFDSSESFENYKCIGIYDIKNDKINNIVKVEEDFGNLFAINEDYAFDLYKYPKLIDIKTGKIISKLEFINSGLEKSSISFYLEKRPKICFNKKECSIAILTEENNIDIIKFIPD